MAVGQLRKWIDDPKPMGLPKEAQNLVILTFAAQTNRTLYRHGGPYDNATLQSIPDDCELRTVDLPPQELWEAAVKRAASIFGLTASRLLSAANVGSVANEVKKKAADSRRACQEYGRRLKERMTHLGLAADNADRVKTATAALRLVEKLHAADVASIVAFLANADVATSETAMGECIAKSAELDGNLDTAGWQTFDLVSNLPEEYQSTAKEILAEVQQALSSDEHVVQLAPALKGAQAKAMRLLSQLVKVKPPISPPEVVTPPIKPPVAKGKTIVGQDTKQNLTLGAAKDTLANLEAQLKAGQSVRVSLSWVIEE